MECTLIVEAVELVNLCGFVVPPKKEEVFGVFYLVRKEEDDCLD
jgi:hypothetical protein